MSADFTQVVASPRGDRKSNRGIIELLVGDLDQAETRFNLGGY